MSDEIQAQFEQAQKDVKELDERPDNDTLLRLYSLFKQASQGDVSGKRPGFTSPVKRAKYDAWAGLEGMTSLEAMQKYIDLVEELRGK